MNNHTQAVEADVNADANTMIVPTVLSKLTRTRLLADEYTIRLLQPLQQCKGMKTLRFLIFHPERADKTV